MSPRNLEGWPATGAYALGDGALAWASAAALIQRSKAYAAADDVKITVERSGLEPAMQAWVASTDLCATKVWI